MPLDALVASADIFADHSTDLVHHGHDHATSFHLIHLPIAKSRLYNMIVGPEIAAYNWAHAKLSGLREAVFGPGIPPEQQGHMVEYFAAGCTHCKHMEPVWKDATALWSKEGGEHAKHVVWDQKQCLDENWKPGPDFEECKAQHIARFPTVRFFAPGSKAGEDFFLERSPEQLVDFAKTGLAPSGDTMPRAHGDTSDMKLVDYYSAACPHCKHLDPVWEDAHKNWDKLLGNTGENQSDDLPLISFEKKECYDDHWNPGKDSAECQKFHVDAFPNIKLFVPDPHGHGFAASDFTGPRTADGLVDFLKTATGMPPEWHAPGTEPAPGSAAAAHAEPAAAAVEPAAPHDLAPVGVKIPEAVKVLASGANAPEAVKAAHEDILAMQGSSPQIHEKAAAAAEAGTRAAAPPAVAEALDQAVKTATMPMTVLSCLPVRQAVGVKNQRQKEARRSPAPAPPTATAQFI